MSSAMTHADPTRRITELEREVARLGADAGFLRSILDSAPDFIVRIASDGTVLYVNRTGEGYRPEDLVGHSVFEFIAAPFHQVARDCYARVIATGVPDAYEAQGIGAYFFVRVGPIRDGDRVAALTLVLTDVSAMKRAEHELRESEAKLRLSVSASGMGLWSWEVATDRLTWDETCGRIAGLRADEGTRSSAALLTLIHPDDQARVRAVLAELEAGGLPLPFEFRIVRRDGTVRWVASQGAALRDDGGRIATVIGGFLDVTQRRATDEQARQAQNLEAVGRLTAGVAHNFNNMLAVILPSLELAMCSAPTDAHPLIDAARAASVRAAELVRQLMQFAGNRPRAASGATQVADVVGRTIAIARSALDHRIDVTVAAAPSLPPVEIDAVQLEQAVLNMLLNARDALETTGREPHIDVVIDRVAAGAPLLQAQGSPQHLEHVRIQVSDNGCGMDEATRQRVFEPFFTTKPIGKGTGIGLSSAFGAVRDAGGFVACASRLGQGTTFTILLPASAAEPPAPAATSLPDLVRGSEHVLVVDDEDALRSIIGRVLREAGYRVTTATDGRDAVEQFRAPGARFDAVILDQAMPRMSGTAALPELLAHDPRIKIIGITGHPEPMAGTRASLAKPLAIATLLATLRGVLDEEGGAVA